MKRVTTSLGCKRQPAASAFVAVSASETTSRESKVRMRISFYQYAVGIHGLTITIVMIYEWTVQATSGKFVAGATTEKCHERDCRIDRTHRKAGTRTGNPAGHTPDPPRSVHLRLLHRQVAVQRNGGSICPGRGRLVPWRHLQGHRRRAAAVHRTLSEEFHAGP